MVRILKDAGADVNMQDKNGKTALIHACELRCNDVVKILIQHANICPDVEDIDGNTALIHSASIGNDVALEMLVKSFRRLGLNVDHFNKAGYTALHVAATNGFLQCARVLALKGKASLTLKDKVNQLTPLEWCLKEGYQKSEVEFLKPSAKFYRVAKLTTTIVKYRKRSTQDTILLGQRSPKTSPTRGVEKSKSKVRDFLRRAKTRSTDETRLIAVESANEDAGSHGAKGTEKKPMTKILEKSKSGFLYRKNQKVPRQRSLSQSDHQDSCLLDPDVRSGMSHSQSHPVTSKYQETCRATNDTPNEAHSYDEVGPESDLAQFEESLTEDFDDANSDTETCLISPISDADHVNEESNAVCFNEMTLSVSSVAGLRLEKQVKCENSCTEGTYHLDQDGGQHQTEGSSVTQQSLPSASRQSEVPGTARNADGDSSDSSIEDTNVDTDTESVPADWSTDRLVGANCSENKNSQTKNMRSATAQVAGMKTRDNFLDLQRVENSFTSPSPTAQCMDKASVHQQQVAVNSLKSRGGRVLSSSISLDHNSIKSFSSKSGFTYKHKAMSSNTSGATCHQQDQFKNSMFTDNINGVHDLTTFNHLSQSTPSKSRQAEETLASSFTRGNMDNNGRRPNIKEVADEQDLDTSSPQTEVEYMVLSSIDPPSHDSQVGLPTEIYMGTTDPVVYNLVKESFSCLQSSVMSLVDVAATHGFTIETKPSTVFGVNKKDTSDFSCGRQFSVSETGSQNEPSAIALEFGDVPGDSPRYSNAITNELDARSIETQGFSSGTEGLSSTRSNDSDTCSSRSAKEGLLDNCSLSSGGSSIESSGDNSSLYSSEADTVVEILEQQLLAVSFECPSSSIV